MYKFLLDNLYIINQVVLLGNLWYSFIGYSYSIEYVYHCLYFFKLIRLFKWGNIDVLNIIYFKLYYKLILI